jgi:hypothetical protein
MSLVNDDRRSCRCQDDDTNADLFSKDGKHADHNGTAAYPRNVMDL